MSAQAEPQSAPAAVGTEVVEVLCAMCHKQVDKTDTQHTRKADPTKGTGDQFRCNGCHRLMKRIATAIKGSGTLSAGWRSLSPEERQTFMDEARDKMGNDLKTALNTVIRMSHISRTQTEWNEDGDFKTEREVEQLPQYKDDPVALANLKKNADRIVCSKSGQELLLVPSYRFSLKNTVVEERAEEVIAQGVPKAKSKAKAKAKRAPRAPTSADGAPSEEGSSTKEDNKAKKERKAPVPQPIPENMTNRLKKVRTKLEESLHGAATLFATASSAEAEEYVPKKIMEKFGGAQDNANKTLDLIKQFIETAVCLKGEAGRACTQAGQGLKDIQELTDKVTELLEDCPLAAPPQEAMPPATPAGHHPASPGSTVHPDEFAEEEKREDGKQREDDLETAPFDRKQEQTKFKDTLRESTDLEL
eukprot:4021265-Pyramimonas_sp.AAC.1